MAGFNRDTMYADNVDFSGSTQPTPKVTVDGQLLIGSAIAPNIRVSTLTAGAGVSITNGAGSITIGLTGGGVSIDSFLPDSGTSPVVPTGLGQVTMSGSGSITTVGGANSLTTQLTGLTANAIQVGAGTTTLTQLGPTNRAVLTTGATGIPTLTALTDGQLIVGSTAGAPAAASLTAGSGISITPGSNSITIAATGGAGDVTAAANLTDNAVVRGDGGVKGVQTSTVLISDAGEMTNPSQPAFSVSLSGNVTNATGDGTIYTIVFDTEQFDQGGDFASNTFTCPIAGKYLFIYQISLANLAAGHTDAIVTVATTNLARFNPVAIVSASGIVSIGGSFLGSYGAASALVMQVTVSGGAKTVTVVGGGAGTLWQGFLAF